MCARRRGVSPVLGVVLMVVLTVLLASVFAAGLGALGRSVEQNERQLQRTLADAGEGVATASGNPWGGERGDLIRPSNNQAGATDVRYRINFTIRSGSDTIGNSLNSIRLEVPSSSPDMFSNTSQSDLDRLVVDEGSDGTVDRDITSNVTVDQWNVNNGGSELKIGFSGSAYTPSANESIVMILDGVDNPNSAGTYDMEAETSGDGNIHNGNVTIVA
jgi:flagellin-like protein